MGFNQSERDNNIARCLLPWLALRKRPLSLGELRHAVAATKGFTSIDDDDKLDKLATLKHIVLNSHGLFILRQRDDVSGPVVEFCHWTAAGMLRRCKIPWKAGETQEWPFVIARACLHYIALPAFDTGPRELNENYDERVTSYPLYEYASRYWAAHLKDVADPAAQSALQFQTLGFLANARCVASSAQALMVASQGQAGQRSIAAAKSHMDALSLVSYLDLPIIASLLPSDTNKRMKQKGSRKTPLSWATCGGSVSVVGLFLERKCYKVDQRGNDGETALSIAASLGHAEIAFKLLEAGARLEASTDSPLILAAERGHRDIVKMLLDNLEGVHLGLTDNDDSTAHEEAANGHSGVVGDPSYASAKSIQGAGADVTDKRGRTPLQVALSGQHWPVIDLLLASRLHLGAYDAEALLARAVESEEWESIRLLLLRPDAGLSVGTPGRLLSQAARSGKESIVSRLIEQYPDILETSDCHSQLTPLLWAAQEGHARVIRALLLHGDKVKWNDTKNKSAALRHAVEAGHDEVATAILDDPSVDTNWYGLFYEQSLVLASWNGMAGTVRRLLELEPYANEIITVNGTGYVALEQACRQGHVETLRELLKNPQVSGVLKKHRGRRTDLLFVAIEANQSVVVDFLARRYDFAEFERNHETGRTALSSACKRGGLETVKVLLAAKSVHPNMADKNGKTPLCWAAEMGHHAIFEYLITLKADVNARTESGWTPLHYAATSGSETIIRTLLLTADPNPVAMNGTTPLVAALQNSANSRAITDLLLSYDHVSLHEQVERGNVNMVRHLLDAGYDIDTGDIWGRTPLHWVVKSESPNRPATAKTLLASDPKPDLSIEDTDGLTALRLALREDQLDVIEVLTASSACCTRGITAKDWLRAYRPVGDPVASIVKVQETAGVGTKVVCLEAKDFSEELISAPASTSSPLRRLFIFTETLHENLGMPNSPPMLGSLPTQCMMPYYNRQSPSGGVHFTFSVYFSSLSKLIAKRMRARPLMDADDDMVMISWIVAKQPYTGSRRVKGWRSVTYFSTLPNGWIPDDGVDFFKQLLDQLRARWIQNCEEGAQLLTASRQSVLKKGGRDPHLIRRLLDDASLWIDLQAYLKAQVGAAYQFASEYKDLDSNEETLKELPGIIRKFDDLIGARLERLNVESQELIQTEFNLTSIAVAKHSTSTSNSMKRLTWITFIFLPLTFISTLFGMNVDALDPPPPWWWYLPLALGTMLTTVGVWIMFKRNATLEEKLEEKFAWLVRSQMEKEE